jgi:hypothetical protein
VTHGSKATFAAAGATVNITGAVIRDIEIKGGPFAANHSVDDGGNTGWSFTSVTGTDLYWVGGSGNWNDTGHWSPVSGGAGGTCVPGPGDNVFFDGGSGFTDAAKTVALDAVSYCRDITFSGAATAPELRSPTGTSININPAEILNIYGSSVWQTGMTIDVNHIYYQNTGENKIITSNGVSTSRRVTLRETGSISLSDDFRGVQLDVENGTFNTNSHKIALTEFNANTNGDKTLNLGSSEIRMRLYFRTNNAKTVVSSNTSHIIFESGFTFLAYKGQAFYNLSSEQLVNGNISMGINGVTDTPISFNTVKLGGNIHFLGNAVMNELVLATGKTCLFEAKRTYTIKKKLTAGDICRGWTIMQSTSSTGEAAVISMPSGSNIDVKQAVMRDLTGTGGATFSAWASVSEGNNAGWSFPSLISNRYYWVGGAGSWNDRDHWAQSSGGTGGACIPGPNDDVFFDGGSGFTPASETVTVEGPAFCRNITVTGPATATAPNIQSAGNSSNILNIYGSSVWKKGQPAVAVHTINYRNTGTAKTITSNGVTMGSSMSSLSSVNFYETGGITLADPLHVASTLSLQAGTFNTGNYGVYIQDNFTAAGATKLNLGSSTIRIAGGNNSMGINFAQNADVDAGTSHVVFEKNSLLQCAGQTFHNVTFMYAGSKSTIRGNLTANRAEFRGPADFFWRHQNL